MPIATFSRLLIAILTVVKASGGKSTLEAKQHTSLGLFKDVELVEDRDKINWSQFYQSVIDRLTKQIPESDLVKMLKLLHKHFRPQDCNALILYGENQTQAEYKR